MNKIEKDKQTVRFMVKLFCRHKLGMEDISDEYRQLSEYACSRLEHCRYGASKPACKNCKTHCYTPAMRAKIRTVMSWVGPRMLIFAPMAAIRHILNR